MHLGLHLSDFGKHNGAFTGGITRLRVGGTVVLVFAFEPWIAWRLSCLEPAEKGLKGEFDADGDVLQDLRMSHS